MRSGSAAGLQTPLTEGKVGLGNRYPPDKAAVSMTEKAQGSAALLYLISSQSRQGSRINVFCSFHVFYSDSTLKAA
jgi:hypothetical protein